MYYEGLCGQLSIQEAVMVWQRLWPLCLRSSGLAAAAAVALAVA